MADTIRTIVVRDLDLGAKREALAREWLVTNGLGGYASGTIGGVPTRRYHALLIAGLPPPFGRRLLLVDFVAEVTLRSGQRVPLRDPDGGLLCDFRLEDGLPIWRYVHEAFELEKRIVMPHAQNTVHVVYRLVGGDAGRLALDFAVAVHNRSHDAPVDTPLPSSLVLETTEWGHELSAGDLPHLRLRVLGRDARLDERRRDLPEITYAWEKARGYEARGVPWAIGQATAVVTRDEPVALIGSTESWDVIRALEPAAALDAEHERRLRLIGTAVPAANTGFGAELVLAADQFIVKPVSRSADAARSAAAGVEGKTVIAGYHWFTDWGRDTMISLEGLTLMTGRESEAASVLRTFAHSLRDGLLPNLFPEGEREGLYHTADATLWLFHAIERYLAKTGDRPLLEALLPALVDVAEHHMRGTRFNIGVDPSDSLLSQGAEGYQLTWMDAKVGDWVVTPRRGKAVEINALWYNALCVLVQWLRETGDGASAERWAGVSRRTRESFNRRFWNEAAGCLYDVVDGEHGDDASCRPNQVFAISLPHAVLDQSRWQPTLDVVRAKLLTPFGLRSLSPDSHDYQPRYDGDIHARDAAYHQGTVWAWLAGPFVDAWLKTHPEDRDGARGFLDGFPEHLSEACVGSISEIFDAETPYAPRGCIAQAWSVAEVLRVWVKTRGL
jgi:glycogen debranching enzyme